MDETEQETAETSEDETEQDGAAEPVEDDNSQVVGDERENGEDEEEDGNEKQDEPPLEQTETPKGKKSYKDLPKEVQEQNAKFAQVKREQERKQEIENARMNAVIEALGGINPYTGGKMTDKHDVDEYLTMKEIEKQGKDPQADYHEFVKAKAKEREQAQAEATKRQEQIEKDRQEFAAKYPKIKVAELMADKKFLSFATGKIGNIPLTEIYAGFEELKNSFLKTAEVEAKNQIAKGKASPGALSFASNQTLTKRVSEMSKEEFDEYDRMVEQGKIKLNF